VGPILEKSTKELIFPLESRKRLVSKYWHHSWANRSVGDLSTVKNICRHLWEPLKLKTGNPNYRKLQREERFDLLLYYGLKFIKYLKLPLAGTMVQVHIKLIKH
jgi:hypothetical protein